MPAPYACKHEGLVYLSGWARSCGAEVPFAYLRDGMRPDRTISFVVGALSGKKPNTLSTWAHAVKCFVDSRGRIYLAPEATFPLTGNDIDKKASLAVSVPAGTGTPEAVDVCLAGITFAPASAQACPSN